MSNEIRLGLSVYNREMAGVIGAAMRREFVGYGVNCSPHQGKYELWLSWDDGVRRPSASIENNLRYFIRGFMSAIGASGDRPWIDGVLIPSIDLDGGAWEDGGGS